MNKVFSVQAKDAKITLKGPMSEAPKYGFSGFFFFFSCFLAFAVFLAFWGRASAFFSKDFGGYAAREARKIANFATPTSSWRTPYGMGPPELLGVQSWTPMLEPFCDMEKWAHLANLGWNHPNAHAKINQSSPNSLARVQFFQISPNFRHNLPNY